MGLRRRRKCPELSLFLALCLTGVCQASPPDLEMGRKVYADHCQVCHGERGDGQTFVANALNPPPRNFTAEPSKKELTRARMVKSITQGRPGTAMMPWQDNLSAKQIHAAISFIRARFMGLRD